ncbi:hypothetical protein OH492_14555 [Vibrio chagasii]|nr:hypothetical protein [Vibrio chagasii]
MFGTDCLRGYPYVDRAADTKRSSGICVGLASGLAVTFEPRLLQQLANDLANLHSAHDWHHHDGCSTCIA